MRLFHTKHGYKFTDGTDLEQLTADGWVDAPYGIEVQEQEVVIDEEQIETVIVPVTVKPSKKKFVKYAREFADPLIKAK